MAETVASEDRADAGAEAVAVITEPVAAPVAPVEVPVDVVAATPDVVPAPVAAAPTEPVANISTGEDRNEPSEEATASEGKLPGRKVFTNETIAEIRALRAEKREDGKPLHSHAALAKRFETTPGAISHIVRNRTYKDPNYVPTNDDI